MYTYKIKHSTVPALLKSAVKKYKRFHITNCWEGVSEAE